MRGASAWLGSENPSELIRYARTRPGPRLDRALRFFALHCGRMLAPALCHPCLHEVIERAEQHLVGLATRHEYFAAMFNASTASSILAGECELVAGDPAFFGGHIGSAEHRSNALAARVALQTARDGYYAGLLAQARDALLFRGLIRGPVGVSKFRADLCRILREVVANPFRRPEVAPEWRTETAVLLARQMLGANDFGAMPILADALQDAGCDCDDILNHCRDAAQVHLRGCWVLELLLSSA